MHESGLLLTLTVSLGAALALGFITQRLHLSPIVGYLLAGLIVGPYTPGFVADRAMATELAEIGIILMMFGVGLHFHLSDLLAVRKVAIPGAVAQSVAATVLGALTGHQFGWTWSASIVFGLALSVASTVMLTRVLVDNHALQTLTGRIAVGWLVVEDIFTIVVLVLLPAIFSDSGGVSVPYVLLVTLAKLAVLVAFVFVIGRRVIPRILTGVAATQSRELFTLSVLILALGIAVGSALGFGVSMALGAFLAGMIVGQSEFSLRAASEALPMRDAFSVLFFVSVGMLLDPRALMDTPGLLLLTLGVILIGKPLVAFVIVTMMGYGSHIALGVSIALSQIGEFSLILATVGQQLNILPDSAANTIVAATIISLTANPIQYKTLGWMEAQLMKSQRLWRALNPRSKATDSGFPEMADATAFRAVVVGYGPIGQTVSRLLQDGGIEPVIVETNLDTVHRARKQGRRAIYGDAAHEDILRAAGIDSAVALVLSSSATDQTPAIIRIARKTNPELRVIARSNYLREADTMRRAGAQAVFAGEGEVALAMTEHVLGFLGATPEQMDRERQRVREEVFPKTAPIE
ncbi:MAG TPA: cation:proton antiporter [Terriglobia bacterium]|nr:cation:proton antiporter [Terriglobia bacterium]